MWIWPNILNQDVDATQLQLIIQTINQENLILYTVVLIVDVVSVILFALFLLVALKPRAKVASGTSAG
jgi:hypothetical protein